MKHVPLQMEDSFKRLAAVTAGCRIVAFDAATSDGLFICSAATSNSCIVLHCHSSLLDREIQQVSDGRPYSYPLFRLFVR
jgi:hypothetical protein